MESVSERAGEEDGEGAGDREGEGESRTEKEEERDMSAAPAECRVGGGKKSRIQKT